MDKPTNSPCIGFCVLGFCLEHGTMQRIHYMYPVSMAPLIGPWYKGQGTTKKCSKGGYLWGLSVVTFCSKIIFIIFLRDEDEF